eukprot:scaffold7729_cov172-Amphora_coffeaeformis.AAC.7
MTTLPTNKEDDINLDEILQVAQEAALLAGQEIRTALSSRGVDRHRAVATTMKSDTTDLVTETDQHCEDLVTQLLQRRYPMHCIIGEESSGSDCHYELTGAPTWTIDPIDGTTNFVHGLSLTAVLIAFLVDRQPVVGVIYDPMADEMFYAVQGQGAFLQRQASTPRTTTSTSATTTTTTAPSPPPQRLQVSGTTCLTRAVISMDAGYGRSVEAVDRYIAVQRAVLLQRVRHVRVLGCCGLTMAYVAAGRLDACMEEGSWEQNTGPKIWDLAAGNLLIHEAGGVTRDLTGRLTKDKPLDLMQRSLFAAASVELANVLLDTIYAA